MTEAHSAAGEDNNARLDNLTLARKEGWRQFVNTPARILVIVAFGYFVAHGAKAFWRKLFEEVDRVVCR